MKITLKSIVSVICVLSMVVVPFTSYAADTNETSEEEYAYGYIPDDPEWVASVPELSAPTTYSAITVPSSCDNSNSPYFPGIGDQGYVGACAAFATTYYQFTYEANKYLDVATTPENTYHPQWTFSLGNRGYTGLNYYSAYSILGNLGALKYSDYSRTYDLKYSANDIEDFSYQISDNTEAIRNALSLRSLLSKVSVPRPGGISIDFSGYDPYYMAKLILAGGSVLTLPSYLSVDKMAANESGSHAGDIVAIRAHDNPRSEAYHAMVVVGYDDNICVDVNEDGIIQDAERGAFKLVNSWGDDYCNNGFIWLLYDALNDVSAHPDTTWESKYNFARRNFYVSVENDITFFYIQVREYDKNFICQVDINTDDFYKLKYMQTSRQTEDSDEPDASADYSGLSMASTPHTDCEHSYTGTLFFDFATLSSPISQIHTGYDWYIKFGVFDSKLKPIGDKRYIRIGETPEDWATSITNIKITDNLGNTISDLGSISSFNHINGDCYYATKKASINIALGDINYDGLVNNDDITCIKEYMVGIMTYSTIQKFIADVNMDGAINARDILEIKRIMVGVA